MSNMGNDVKTVLQEKSRFIICAYGERGVLFEKEHFSLTRMQTEGAAPWGLPISFQVGRIITEVSLPY